MKPEEVGQKALLIVEQSKALVIRNAEDRAKAKAILDILVARKKSIEDAFGDLKKSAHDHWKAVCAKQASYWDPVDTEARYLKGRIGAYDDQKEKERKAEESRLRAEAIKAEEARRLQEAIDAPADERSAILAEPIVIAPIVIPVEEPKDIIFRTIWSAEVTNLIALIQSVAKGETPLGAVEANMKYLNQRASSDKGEMRIPGVVAHSRKV